MKKPRKKEICNREQKTLPIHPSFLFRSIKNLDFIFHRFHQLEQGFLLFFGPQAWHNIRAWVRREQWKRKNRR